MASTAEQLATSFVLARRCGKMVQRKIRCIVGDRVAVEVCSYDLARGRIVWREKPNNR